MIPALALALGLFPGLLSPSVAEPLVDPGIPAIAMRPGTSAHSADAEPGEWVWMPGGPVPLSCYEQLPGGAYRPKPGCAEFLGLWGQYGPG